MCVFVQTIAAFQYVSLVLVKGPWNSISNNFKSCFENCWNSHNLAIFRGRCSKFFIEVDLNHPYRKYHVIYYQNKPNCTKSYQIPLTLKPKYICHFQAGSSKLNIIVNLLSTHVLYYVIAWDSYTKLYPTIPKFHNLS